MLRRENLTAERFMATANASLPTFKRDLELLRDNGAVIAWDAYNNQYRLRNPEWPGVVAMVMNAMRVAA